MATHDDLDVIVIGAGFGGMYALHHLREMGLSVRVYEGATDVGGTWYWNGYPGARVDGPSSPFYCFTFSAELMREWDWKETQSDQPMILAYLNHVADKFDLRRDIQFETWVEGVHYDESTQRWTIETQDGDRASAQFLICAVGALSTTHKPSFPGLDDFKGDCHHTGDWPHEPVSFEGKRVGVIGTGSSGMQAIPEIAKEAAHVTVFQRTPQFAFPARNRPMPAEELAHARDHFEALREGMLVNYGGMPFEPTSIVFADHTPEEREAHLEALWQQGSFKFITDGYADLMANEECNNGVADFVRGKIRETVEDPEVADKLMPDHFLGTKRPILDNGYFECFNRANVTLVDLRESAIDRITPTGLRLENGTETPLDMLVLATGFDAISGTMLKLNPKGRGGVDLRARWQDQYGNYLGLAVEGLPNLFMIHGPGSPGVFYHMPLGAERQITWIGECIRHLRDQGFGAIEAEGDAQNAWGAEVTAIADQTLYPRTDSWWTGSNIPGKPRVFSAHLASHVYYERLAEVEAKGYPGFVLEKTAPAD